LTNLNNTNNLQEDASIVSVIISQSAVTSTCFISTVRASTPTSSTRIKYDKVSDKVPKRRQSAKTIYKNPESQSGD
jgi:hypothetical protein